MRKPRGIQRLLCTIGVALFGMGSVESIVMGATWTRHVGSPTVQTHMIQNGIEAGMIMLGLLTVVAVVSALIWLYE